MHDLKKKTIRGREFRTQAFGAKRQLRLLPGVLRLMSGPFGSLVDSFKGLADGPLQDLLAAQKAKGKGAKLAASDLKGIDISKALQGLKGEAITSALVTIADELDNGGEALILDLLRDTFLAKGPRREDGMDSCAEDFDTVFQSDFLTLAQVLAWVIQVNYAPFLRSGSNA